MKKYTIILLLLFVATTVKAQNSELQLKINAIKLQYFGLQPAWYGELVSNVPNPNPNRMRVANYKLSTHPGILINNNWSGLIQLANYTLADVEKITIIPANSGITNLYSPYKEYGAIMVYIRGYTGSRVFPYMTQELGQTVYTAP